MLDQLLSVSVCVSQDDTDTSEVQITDFGLSADMARGGFSNHLVGTMGYDVVVNLCTLSVRDELCHVPVTLPLKFWQGITTPPRVTCGQSA